MILARVGSAVIAQKNSRITSGYSRFHLATPIVGKASGGVDRRADVAK